MTFCDKSVYPSNLSLSDENTIIIEYVVYIPYNNNRTKNNNYNKKPIKHVVCNWPTAKKKRIFSYESLARRITLVFQTYPVTHPPCLNRVHTHTHTDFGRIIIVIFMVAKFHDNNNSYCLRACVRNHSKSKFGLVWVGVCML